VTTVRREGKGHTHTYTYIHIHTHTRKHKSTHSHAQGLHQEVATAAKDDGALVQNAPADNVLNEGHRHGGVGEHHDKREDDGALLEDLLC
jgi:hypothetical protein